jgi:hypothetical protein
MFKIATLVAILKPFIAKMVLDYIFSIVWDELIKNMSEWAASTSNNLDDKTVEFIDSHREELKQKIKAIL